MCLYLPGNGLHCLWVLAEGDSAFFYIGTGYINFQHIHRLVPKTLHHINIFLRGLSADIDHDFRVILF